MKSTLILIPVFALFTLFSCNQANNDSGKAQTTPSSHVKKEQAKPAVSQPDQQADIKTAEKPMAEENSEKVMLNPPHGQPYHRCEIPVGAPLPQTTNATTQTTNEQVEVAAPQTTGPAPSVENNPYAPTIENAKNAAASQTQSSSKANTGTKPRLNPPHGQPWHRCDIAVGSPLP